MRKKSKEEQYLEWAKYVNANMKLQELANEINQKHIEILIKRVDILSKRVGAIYEKQQRNNNN
jgi:transposase